MSLSFPILPDSLDIPARHLVFLYIFGGMYIGDLGWGPRTRHQFYTTLVPLFLWGGNHAASRRTIGVCTYVYGVFEWERGQAHKIKRQFNLSGNIVRTADRAR